MLLPPKRFMSLTFVLRRQDTEIAIFTNIKASGNVDKFFWSDHPFDAHLAHKLQLSSS